MLRFGYFLDFNPNPNRIGDDWHDMYYDIYHDSFDIFGLTVYMDRLTLEIEDSKNIKKIKTIIDIF
jgi:hypothetical protein